LTQGDPQEAAGVREGQILAGKYRVEKVLGVGGMGVVVAAQHVQLDERVAIKFLLPAMLDNQDVVGRFAREARAAVKIKSEHVARVSDVGSLENGSPYMVMEFLDGVDLAAWIQQRGPLPIEQAVDFVVQACVGVASAHAIGIVHRDLKPGNLFCLRGNDGQFVIKVLDFGISKVTNASDSRGSMTHTAAVMGSPYYMSPEQMVSAKDVDGRTDIWALGVVLYELLTGTRPFTGESLPEIAIKVATASFPPLRSFRPDAPSGLDSVVLKCLEKDKKRRYANVAELALALADFGSKQSGSSIERIVRIIEASGLSTAGLPPASSPAVTATTPGVGTMTAFEPAPSAPAPLGTMAPSATTAPRLLGVRRRGRIAVAMIGAAGVLAVAAGVAWRRPKPEPSSATGLIASTPSTSPSVAASPAKSDPAEPENSAEPVGAAAAATPNGADASDSDAPSGGPGIAPGPAHNEHQKTAPANATSNTPRTANPGSPPRPPSTHSSSAATPKCQIVTEYDSAGDAHFKKVCK
jgi:tRNA A-37 threonylcarbamoyl transferase component Bud32